MKKFVLSLLALLTLAVPVAFADHHNACCGEKAPCCKEAAPCCK